MSDEQEKRDNENYAKNFTRIPNIVLESYRHLTYEEKFLYIKMREVYWDTKPRFATLREISHLTGYAISALSRILPRLNTCGLVHAEIKQEFNPDGSKKGKPKYYISIPDIWELNRKYFECSPEERFDPSDVLQKNENVLQKNENVLQKNENVLQKNDVVPPEEHFCGTKASSQARSQLSKDNKDITKDTLKIESIGNEVLEVEPLATNVAPSPVSQSSLSVSSQEHPQEEVFPIDVMATGKTSIVEQKSFMPIEMPKASSKKREKHTEPLSPKSPPEMPPGDMAWGTKKCLMMFDAWRGKSLIGYYKLTQASTCAKGLADQYTEEEVRRVYQSMSEDEYWKEKGLDICNVANNIHKEINKVRSRQKKSANRSPETETRPSFLVSEEQKQKNIEKLRTLAAAKAAKE